MQSFLAQDLEAQGLFHDDLILCLPLSICDGDLHMFRGRETLGVHCLNRAGTRANQSRVVAEDLSET